MDVKRKNRGTASIFFIRCLSLAEMVIKYKKARNLLA